MINSAKGESMKIRKTAMCDVDSVLFIINEAKQYFKEHTINQWQEGYPNKDAIINDINNNEGYVLEENNEILATCMISIKEDPTYNYIEDGSWLSSGKYAVIHRVATRSDQKGKGLASLFINEIRNIYPTISSIRVDTHPDNTSMQQVFNKNDFIYCGIIYLANKDKRMAYEKLV